MKIIHVSDAFAPVMGGIESQVTRLAEQLAARGHENIVLTTTLAQPRKGWPVAARASASAPDKSASSPSPNPSSSVPALPDGLVQDQSDPAVPFTVIRSEWPNPFGAPVDPRAAGRFADYILAEQPDVVHAHVGELTPVATAVLAKLRGQGIPTVVSVHSVWSEVPTVPVYWSLARAMGLAEAPVLWLPNSELTARRVRKVVNPALVHVQNNTVDPAGWLVDPVPHQGLVAVSATRFAPRKRVPELLRILRTVGERLDLNGAGLGAAPAGSARDVLASVSASDGSAPAALASVCAPAALALRVVVAGEGPGLESARRYIAKHGMDSWVRLPGRMTKQELVDLYAGADVYLAPSVKDAFSISGLEARAAGLAILSRAQSGFGAAVLDGVEGRAVQTDAHFGEVLVDWARDPAQVAAYKDHNRAVEMPYTWDNAIPQFEERYQEAAKLVGADQAG